MCYRQMSKPYQEGNSKKHNDRAESLRYDKNKDRKKRRTRKNNENIQ